ncbi:hypothetical protein [Janthinobacterium sp. NKUCC08_JDC]|uniref:hypothetical protein n=1 Tax=Janthinobacterium sp. NKUCC08_JDC TaxID=2842122 RepID=UPI001C5B6144|nr:hypothetical protein [Janthinobacterium sp. NKUCC08_JDC]MBW3500999.1 hypothetical protein [Janthinobacterium sp. NKUCC08_JDC]
MSKSSSSALYFLHSFAIFIANPVNTPHHPLCTATQPGRWARNPAIDPAITVITEFTAMLTMICTQSAKLP